MPLKNTGILEQNEEFHVSTSQNPHFLLGTIFFFILSERSCENLSFSKI